MKSVLGNLFNKPKRLEGRVRWFNKEKGFGKVAPVVSGDRLSSLHLEAPEELFVHKSDINGGIDGPDYAALAPGTLVTYEVGKQKDGKPCAKKVKCEGRAKLALAPSVG